MAEVCCLCSSDVSSSTKKAKRRLLNGRAAAGAKETLNELLLENNLTVDSLPHFKEENACICKKCKDSLEELPILEQQVKKRRNSLLKLINPVVHKYLSSSLHKGVSRKRTHPAEDDEQQKQPNKSSRLDEKSVTPTRPRQQASSRVTVSGLANYLINNYCKNICAESHNSILQDSHEAIKRFSWKTVWLELLGKMPTLMRFLATLVPDVEKNQPSLCLIACMLLKHRSQLMSLIQKVIAILLYGNGTHKKVYNALHPLMITVSHSTTIKLIDRISLDHDMLVHQWSDNQLEHLKGKTHLGYEAHSVVGIGEEGQESQDDRYVFDADSMMDKLFNEEDDGSEWCADEDKHDYDESELCDDDVIRLIDELSESNAEEVLSIETPTNVDSIMHQNCSTDREASEPKVLSEKSWTGFKLIGDNIDKNIHRSFQRLNFTTKSLHYFHSYAVLDRVDFSALSDEPPKGDVDFNTIVPTANDVLKLKENFAILISRILANFLHVPNRTFASGDIVWHISHKYFKEMALPSVCIPTGVQLRNENKLDELCDILSELQTYCPLISVPSVIKLPNGNTLASDDVKYHEILFGGDQLTRARAVGAIQLRAGHDEPTHKLIGLVPVIEDWHTRQTLLKVIWLRLYKSESSKEKGTLYQIRNLLNRTSVPNDPAQNMKATEDFLTVVLFSHIVAAAKSVVTTDDLSFGSIAKKIIEKFVDFGIIVCNNSETKMEDSEDDNSDEDVSNEDVEGEQVMSDGDGVYNYACEVMTLGLLWNCYHDAIREGDGDRIMLIWKFLLLVFKASRRKNYSVEAALLLLQHQYFLSPRKAAQLTWSRFVNTQGRGGCNIPCDLHMEHLNRRLKVILSHLGSNIQSHSILRAGRSVGVIHNICSLFEKETHIRQDHGSHKTPAFQKDFNLVLTTLEEAAIYQNSGGRQHNTFKAIQPLLKGINKDKLLDWMVENVAPKLLF